MNALVVGLALIVAAPAPKEAPKKDPAHVGDWVVESVMVGGQNVPAPPMMIIRLTTDGKFERKEPDGKVVIGGTFTADAKQSPAHLDITNAVDQQAERTSKAIFKIDGDILTICSGQGDNRPTTFESTAGSSTVLMVLKRKKD
ncbi:MAG TPA: TIGR03067 domain-containing protein [Gemmataceae bacterium]|jgi:uncharacterized protein (TIGR03067 family)|nr:TIGR03067 domain-containing protein [Gemmataceae bacterium]